MLIGGTVRCAVVANVGNDVGAGDGDRSGAQAEINTEPTYAIASNEIPRMNEGGIAIATKMFLRM